MDVRVVYLTLALEDRIGGPSSNSGLICYVHFLKNVFGKGMKLSLLIQSYVLKSKLSSIDLYKFKFKFEQKTKRKQSNDFLKSFSHLIFKNEIWAEQVAFYKKKKLLIASKRTNIQKKMIYTQAQIASIRRKRNPISDAEKKTYKSMKLQTLQKSRLLLIDIIAVIFSDLKCQFQADARLSFIAHLSLIQS